MQGLKLGDLFSRIKGRFVGEETVLDLPYKGITVDSRKDCWQKLFLALKGERFDGHDFALEALQKGAWAVVLSKDIPCSPRFVVDDTLSTLHNIAFLWRSWVSPFVVAVTGSSGKTTTKEMLNFVLSRFSHCEATKYNENNLIGLPLNLANMKYNTQIFIAEMGTNSPGEIRRLSSIVLPDVLIVTTIGESHLQGLKNIEGVFEEKISALNYMESGYLVFNSESPFVDRAKRMARERGIEFLSVGLKGEHLSFVMIDPFTFEFRLNNRRRKVKLNVAGIHNGYNVSFVLSVVNILGFDWEKALDILKEFKPIRGRFLIEKVGEITLIDDTYNANPVSTKAALSFFKNLSGRKIFVFGSMLELGSESEMLHREIGEFAFHCGVDLLLTFGNEAYFTHVVFKEKGGNSLHFENHQELLDYLLKQLKGGDTVLIKGSRGMRMEKIVEGIKGCFGS